MTHIHITKRGIILISGYQIHSYLKQAAVNYVAIHSNQRSNTLLHDIISNLALNCRMLLFVSPILAISFDRLL